MAKYFPLVLLSLQITGGLSGRPWMRLPSRVPDVCSGKFWGTSRSSILLTLGISWPLRRRKVLQSFVCRQVCLFSWNHLAMEIIYTSYKGGTWTSFLQYQSTREHSCESCIYGKFYSFSVPSANCIHFFYLRTEIYNILHPKTSYFWCLGCVRQAYNLFCLFTRRTHSVIYHSIAS